MESFNQTETGRWMQIEKFERNARTARMEWQAANAAAAKSDAHTVTLIYDEMTTHLREYHGPVDSRFPNHMYGSDMRTLLVSCDRPKWDRFFRQCPEYARRISATKYEFVCGTD